MTTFEGSMKSFRMESFRIHLLVKMESFRSNGIFWKISFRKYFLRNLNLSESNHSLGFFQKIFFDPTGRKNASDLPNNKSAHVSKYLIVSGKFPESCLETIRKTYLFDLHCNTLDTSVIVSLLTHVSQL
jgi:hypothetical protein